MRARHLFDPPGDARPAPHSGPAGLRRADPLRPTKPTHPTKPTKRPDPADPAARRKFPRRKSPSPPLGAARRGLAFNKMPLPEETATAAVSKSLPPRRPGDALAPLPHALVASQAEAPSQIPLSALWISLSALWGETAGVRWGLPQIASPAPLTLPSPPGRQGARLKGTSLAPNAATTAPAPRFRAGAAPRPGPTPHPEN
jgi:hypothetical protein